MNWLERDILLAVHEEQIREHGGSGGTRDMGLLDSALARPQQRRAHDEDAGVSDLGALYAIAIAHNHPFVDGNKRTALVALELFLDLNGYDLMADDATCVQHVLGIASGEETDANFTLWVHQSALRRDS